MGLERRDGETDLQYHKRLVYGKLVDKTLQDIDYTELAPLVYGKDYAPDVARRMMYGSCRTLKLMEQNGIESETVSNKPKNTTSQLAEELDERRVELYKERQKFFDQRREYNKILAAEAREEHLHEEIIEAANNLNETIGQLYIDSEIDVSGERVRESGKVHEAVLVLSDWHYGMTTSNVFNEYNTEICKKRVRATIEAAAERIWMYNCQRLYVVVLGDLWHGAIHTSARVASEELVCDQIMQVSEILAQSIERLAQICSQVIVCTTYGNHARTVQNKADSVHRDNMEKLVPWWLTERLKSLDNVFIADDNDNEFILIDSCGYEICGVHGDNDTVTQSPRLLTTLFSKKYGKDIDCILLGDKHHRESFDELGVTAMICGSLCGTDDYANDKRKYSKPSQLLLITTEGVGLDAEYRLACE